MNSNPASLVTLAIEPNSRNLIVYADDSSRDNPISVRGPYTVAEANESDLNQIRMPAEAMMTLGVKVNDTIVVDDSEYLINETLEGESNVFRLPDKVIDFFNLEEGNVIQNSRLKEIFESSLITHSYDGDNYTVNEKFIVSSRDVHASTYEIFLDNHSIVYSSGIFKKNSTYDIFVNGEYFTSFNFKKNSNITFNYGNQTVDVVFKDLNTTSIKKPVLENQGNFLNIKI